MKNDIKIVPSPTLVFEAVKDEKEKTLLHSAANHILSAWNVCIPYMQGQVNPKHTRTISEVGKDIPELGKVIGSMENEKLSEFLMLLSEKIGRDGQANAGMGRNKLATELHGASLALYEAIKAINSIKK